MFILIIHITAILAVDPQAPLRDQLAKYKMEVTNQVTTASRALDRCNVALMDVMVPMEATRKFAKWTVTDFQDVLQENEELQKRIVERAKEAGVKMSQIRTSVATFIVGIETILAEEDAELKARIEEAKELLHANDKLAAGMILDYQEAERLKASILENAERVQQGTIDALWGTPFGGSDPELTRDELSSIFSTDNFPIIYKVDCAEALQRIYGQLKDFSAGLANLRGSLYILAKRARALVDESSTLVTTYSGLHARHEELLGKKRELDDAMMAIMVHLDKNVKEYLQTLLDCGDVLDGIPGGDIIRGEKKSRCVDVLGRSFRLLAAGYAQHVERVKRIVDIMENLLKEAAKNDSVGNDGQNGYSDHGGMGNMRSMLPIIANFLVMSTLW